MPSRPCLRRSEHMSASEAAKLDRLLAERQADRLPSVAAAVGRKGELLWSAAVGSASYDDDRAATPDTQYRIGSITKTFTATAVMQLYAAGELDLDDRLEQHIDGIANGSPTIRRLLAHLSGLQREAGEMFVTGESPTEEQLIDSMSGIEFVSRPGEQHHYSNLAFALLGQVVARKSGTPYMQYVDERIIGPLGLGRTTWLPQAPQAQGYLVDEYARTVWTEPETDMAGTAAAGQLWSTVEDLDALGGVPRGGRRRRARHRRSSRRCGSRRSCTTPTSGCSAGGSGSCSTRMTARSTAVTAARWPGTSQASTSTAKTGLGAAGLTNSGTRGNMDLFAIALAAKAAEHLAGRDRAVAARGGAAGRRPAAARPLVVGGQRVPLLVAGRDAAREVRGGAAGQGRDGVRARRRRLARRRAAASAASGCGSTATG